jgi:hypothetical protein
LNNNYSSAVSFISFFFFLHFSIWKQFFYL